MSLTGSAFLVTVALCTVVVFVVSIVVWPYLAEPSPVKILARAGMLLTVNFMVLLTAATQLNATFLFFADWTDLRGAISGTVTATTLTRGTSASGAAARAVKGQSAKADRVLPPLPADAALNGGLITYTVTGPLSGLTGEISVQLPPGYMNPVNAPVRYPVIETFGGYPALSKQLIVVYKLGDVVARQSAAKRMRPALIVEPQLEFPRGADTECVNGSPGNPQVETWLAQDVPNWVAHTFRVRTDRGSWATLGVSAGGWCAAMVAMLHPAQFAGAISLLGYFHPEFGPFYEPYPPGDPLGARYDLVGLVRRSPPPVALWLETSHADEISYPSSAALLKVARPPLSIDALVLQHAGHYRSVAVGVLPQATAWLGANLPGFRATP